MQKRNQVDLEMRLITGGIGLVFLILLSAIIFFPVVSLFGGFGPNYSGGFRVGAVLKASEKGILCSKTFAGELILDGFGSRATNRGVPSEQATPISNVWEFAATDKKVVESLIDAADRGKRVRVVYSQWLIKPFCLHSDYVVTAVKVVE